MIKQFGNKIQIAIEYQIESKEMGYAKLWFNNQPLGSIEDLIYWESYLLQGLNQIKQVNPILSFYNLEDPSHLFSTLVNQLSVEGEKNSFQYLISLGTFCDDFTVFAFKEDHEIHLLWKLNYKEEEYVPTESVEKMDLKALWESNHIEPPIFSDIDSKDQTVKHFKISIVEFNRFVNEFEMHLREELK